MFALAVLLAIAAPATTTASTPTPTPAPAPMPASRAGLYRIQQMEMAGGLELRADGRFFYRLEYGAVSEMGEGVWSATAEGITITSDPMPKAASFELVADDPAPAGELWMTLDNPGFDWGQPLSALGTAEEAAQGRRLMADSTGQVDLEGRPIPPTMSPLIPVFGTTGQSFPLSSGRGHRLRFRFHANDLGTAAFDRQLVRADKGALVMERYETSIRFLPDGH